MNSVEFHSSEMNNVILSLEKALTKFDTAISLFSSLNIPDFSYSSWLNNCSELMSQLKANCKEDIIWAKKCVSNFDNYNSDSISIIGNVDTSELFNKNNTINVI